MLADEAEMLQRLWFPVARLEDLEAGRPLAGALLGERIVVYRVAADLTVAIDRCPHRGAQLSLGHLRGETLECAYHGWRWDHAGTCALVPSQPEVHSNATLHTLPSCERFGLIWTCLESAAAAPPSIPEIEQDSDGGWEVELGDWFDVRCGLRSITENFRDSSHFAFVHRETFGDVNPAIGAYTVRAEGRRLAWELEVTFGSEWSTRDDADGVAPKYRFGAASASGASADTPSRMALKYRFELPALSYVYTEHEGGGRRLVCQAAAPLDLEGRSCRVFFFVAANAEFRRRNGPLSTQVEIEARVFAEDVPIVESLDPTEAPLELEGQAHVRADRYSVAYRKLYREMLTEFRSSREREEAKAGAE
jgi:phenylpropionate dioxygenase-like ring-hydroxylating dioxygenase large terminal subunit